MSKTKLGKVKPLSLVYIQHVCFLADKTIAVFAVKISPMMEINQVKKYKAKSAITIISLQCIIL